MNKVDVLVGKRMRARRQALKMSQTDLAERVGVRFQQIQKYESGANRVSASRLWAIAEALDVDVVFFFEGIRAETVEGPETSADRFSFMTDKESLELLNLFGHLPAAQKKAVLSIVRSMAEPEDGVSRKFGS